MTQYLDNLILEKNLTHLSYSPTLLSTASTLDGTLTLTNTSNFLQVITGTATGYKIKLPDATTLTAGWKFEIWNLTTQALTLQYSDATTAMPIPISSFLVATVETVGTAKGTWLFFRAFTGTASGILNYTASTAETFTLSSGTGDVVIGGTTPMSITPIAGTYACWYEGSISITGNNTTVRTALYRAGSIWTDSLRTIKSSVSTFLTTHVSMAVISVNGAQAIEAYVARDSNTLTITGRSLIIIRLGD